jgi:class 3 adenylate cyclase
VRAKITFQVSIALLFAVLIVPTLLVVLTYGYRESERTLLALSEASINRARDDGVALVGQLFEPVASTLRIVARTAATQPGFFRAEKSRDVLYAALNSAPQIDAVYTSFEDGYHRVVTRVDSERRRGNPRFPAAANWHSSFIDPYVGSPVRLRHRTFFNAWPQVIAGGYSEPTIQDPRTDAQYQGAKRTHALFIGNPSINHDTGFPIIAMGYPIIKEHRFIGNVSANITFTILSQFLAEHKASPGSTTLIVDRDGGIIAHPNAALSVRRVDGNVAQATLGDLTDPAIAAAVRNRKALKSNRFRFKLPDGTEEFALFSPLPATFNKPWEVLIVGPIDDFIGDLKRTSRNLEIFIGLLTLLELALIIAVARAIARPIEAAARRMDRIGALDFSDLPAPNSFVREIFRLQNGVRLMNTSLRSFAAFVPVGIVRQLVETGKPLTLGGEARFMSIFFTDLENFSTISEHLTPDELMLQVSSYFEVVTNAVTQESGTIDKFIGDSVMAFWGAPAPVDDVEFRACVAAVRSSYRMQRLNEQWERDGSPRMRVRIGLHCDVVVVGNVGSADRLSYTVMGDGVNVASRLEGTNKTFHTTICMSDKLYEAVADRVYARPVQYVTVKGREERFMAYELLGIRNTTDPELAGQPQSERLCAMTAAAMDLLIAEEPVEAHDKYGEILAIFPDDPVAKHMFETYGVF